MSTSPAPRSFLRRSAPLFLAGSIAIAVSASFPRPVVAAAAVDGPLEESMEQMNASMKALLKGVNAENRDASLAHVAKLQAGVLSAKLETPPSAEKVEEAKRAAFVGDFRKQLVRVLAATCELETAILEGKYDDANAVLKNKLAALKKEGHAKFDPDEEE
jgi:hypothetical protein